MRESAFVLPKRHSSSIILSCCTTPSKITAWTSGGWIGAPAKAPTSRTFTTHHTTADNPRVRLQASLLCSARTASTQGVSLCYPMYHEYPEVEEAYLARDQYFLGNQMFAAPIVYPTDPLTGQAPVDVWIPE